MVESHRMFRIALLTLAATAAGYAQQYSISTIAGAGPLPSAASAKAVSVGQPVRATVDSAGNLYFTSLNSVFMLSAANGSLTRVAGNGHAGYSGDGGPATSAELSNPQGLAIDSLGNLYIADSNNNRVRVVSGGIIYNYVGNGQPGQYGPLGDGGPATLANLHLPMGLAVDATGNLYIADTGDNCIRIVTFSGRRSGGGPPPAATIYRFAGDSMASYTGDGGMAIYAELNRPQDMAVDSSGNVYIADTGNGLIRKVTTDGIINYIAGTVVPLNPSTGAPPYPVPGYSGDGGPANSAGLIDPTAVALDSAGNIYEIESSGSRLRKIDASGIINSICGNRGNGFSGDGGAASLAMLNNPVGMAVDANGNIYIADTLNGRVRKIDNSLNISTVAGNGVFSYSGDGGQANAAQINLPQGVALDGSGNVYFSDTNNNVVRKVAANGVISTVAGNGTAGFGGDGGAGISAQLNQPQGLALDKNGNLYIADSGNNRVRKLTPAGTISTWAGSGTAGSTGDNGAATSAALYLPFGVAVDADGNVFIAEFGGNRVRKVNSGGAIATVAGAGTAGYTGDGGPASAAQLTNPKAVAVDANGNIYIADTNNYAVRMVTKSGVISTIAGNGTPGSSGDFGPATSAQVGTPSGVAVDSAGNVYISDGGARVRKVYAGGGIETIAGNGTRGYLGDGGTALLAQLDGPAGLAVDGAGRVYVAEGLGNAPGDSGDIRLLTPMPSGLSIGAVTNGASNLAGPISPGEVLVIYGAGLGPSQLATYQLDMFGNLTRSLNGTAVYIGGIAAPVLYTWATQVAAIVPYGLTGTSAQVVVKYQDQATAPATVQVAPSSPALFTLDYSGRGQAVALNEDGTLNGVGNPARAGSSITLYLTGAGLTTPAQTDGSIGAAPLPTAPVTVTIGGQTIGGTATQVAGSVAGVMTVTVQIPSGAGAGSAVPVTVGAPATQLGVTIAVM
jgi:uncharacterized protein (TIGR03437 family)